MTRDLYDHDRAGLVPTERLSLEQARHEASVQRTRGQYVPWSRLLMTLAVIFALVLATIVAVAGLPPIDFNAWSRS